MAKRSDFAQKLLDDLRLRKERMAASQSSKASKPMAGDANAYSKQAYRGSREMKTHQTNGFRTGSTHNGTVGSNKSLSIKEASKDIVPAGRGRSSEQIDLSMALAFALENGGQLRRTDSSGNSSMLGFLHQIGRRSVGLTNMERSGVDRCRPSTGSFPTLSHLHIKEISKGAQKLNQILRACSNGLNFDGYSIEIGRELLKGAMDLEESLRMLVNLQEASEYMIRPQNKTRITLLDDDEEDDDNTVKTAEHWQLDRPRFSFDKPSRNSHYIHEVAKTDLKQRLMALTYPSEATNFNHDRHALSTSSSVSHKRSTSCGPNVKTLTEFSEQKNHSSASKSKPQKARIPNVIAKLMGLEELPESEDSRHTTQKESSSKKKIEGTSVKKTTWGSSTHEQKTKDAKDLVPPVKKKKQKQPNQIQDTIYALQAEENQTNHYANCEATHHYGKPPQKVVEELKPARGSNKANTSMKIDKNKSNIIQLSQSTISRKDIQETQRRPENTELWEHKGKVKDETRELNIKHELHQQMARQTQKEAEAASTLQEQTECNISMHKPEKIDANKLASNNQPKSPLDLRFQQPYLVHNFVPQDIKHHAGKSQQQIAEVKIQVRRPKGSEVMSRSLPKPIYSTSNWQRGHGHSQTNQATSNNKTSTESIYSMQSKELPNNRHQEDLVQDQSATRFNINRQDLTNRISNKNSFPKDQISESTREKISIARALEEKPVHLQVLQKAKITKAQMAESPRRINELVTRRSGPPRSSARPPKDQTPILQEVKQRRHVKLSGIMEAEEVRASTYKEAEACIVESNKLEASIQQKRMLREPQIKAEPASNLCSLPADDKCESLKGTQILAPNETCQSMISSVAHDQQCKEIDFDAEELRSHKIVLDPPNGTHETSTHIMHPSQLESQKVCQLQTPEPLTEGENHLKQILIKSQVFLNTAEALFKLNIPFGILHAGGVHGYHDEDTKLILDCGYEVMKRKGQRQELIIHPFMRISITSPKVKSLDDLIKQLHEDFEKLKLFSRDDNAECVNEDYLAKMLESDVYDWEPDANCMWDIVWDKMMFAFLDKVDVIRDMERYVLNGLIDEVTRDLLL